MADQFKKLSNQLKLGGKDRHTRDQLQMFSKEDLIDYVLRLEASNFQYKNIITKLLSKNQDNKVHLENNSENNIKPLNIASDTTECKKSLKTLKRPFDFKRFAKRHVLMRFLYFGWDYQGFVCQIDTNDTIEHHIFEALTKTCLIESRNTSNYFRCGRTDKEVSAFYQIISIDIRSKFPFGTELNELNNIEEELDYCGILNRVLPKNIQCIAWMPVRCSLYNARFDCSSRTYRYYFPRGNLNIKAMSSACKYLECEGDFRNLCKMDVENGVTSFRRRIEKAQIIPCYRNSKEIKHIEDDCDLKNEDIDDGYKMFYLEIKANAFLWHQIRCIMSILLLVGQEKEQPEVIIELLDVEKNPCKPQYPLAIGLPLNLYHCEMRNQSKHYRSEEENKPEKHLKCICTQESSAISEWYFKDSNLSRLIGNLQEEWTRLNIRVTMIRSVVDKLEEILRQHSSSSKVQNQSTILETGPKSSQYKKLMNRARCESLENRIQHFAKKQRSV